MHRSWTALALLLSAQGSLALGPALTGGNGHDRPEPMPAMSDFRRPMAVENIKVDLYMHIASTKANKDMITEKVVADQVCREYAQRAAHNGSRADPLRPPDRSPPGDVSQVWLRAQSREHVSRC